MLTVQVVGDRAVQSRFDKMDSLLHAALLKKISFLSEKLKLYIKTDKLSGQVLNRRTGALVNSIQAVTTDSPDMIQGTVFSAGNVKYAGIHEYGGVIKHPGGTAYMPITGKGVVFVSNAKAEILRLTKRTKAHDIPMPMRSFMRSGLADMRQEIISGMKAAVVEGISK